MSAPPSGWRSQQDVPLPRAIDPNRFAAAREQEILAITDAVKNSEFGAQYGVDGIPRHLRRRTKSHNPYNRRKRPSATKQAVLAGGGGGPGEPAPADREGDAAQEHPPFTNRKMRRRPGKLAEAALAAARWTEAAVSGSDTDAPLKRRLETHLWHAKRMDMQPMWGGWVLPEGEPGRGRGSRSFVHRLNAGAIMHDASYWCPLGLFGSSQAVSRCLEQVLDPVVAKKLAKELQRRLEEGSGWEAETTTLHQPGAFPRGAICPVSPLFLEVDGNEAPELILWVHGAAAASAFAALSAAVARAGTDLRVLDLRRLEVRGAGCDTALARALFNGELPAALQALKPGQAAHVVLPDPRAAKPVTLGPVQLSILDAAPGKAANIHLLDKNHPIPLPEAAVAAARQQARAGMVCGDPAAAAAASALFSANSARFAAVFVRQRCRYSGWSVLLPPGWVPPLWLALAFQGCRAEGQREWWWLYTLNRRPFFPHDAPNTELYSSESAKRLQARQEEENRKPKGRQVAPAAAALDWASLRTLEAEERSDRQIYVARSEKAMIEGVFGSDAGNSVLVCRSASLQPVTDALAAGKLRWEERKSRNFDDLCLAEVSVEVIKRGKAAEGATLCVIAGAESEHTTQPCYLRAEEAEEHGARHVAPNHLLPIGHVTSPAPHGTARATPSLALCSAAAFWRLRSLQFYEPRRDKGTVTAWLVNPRSSVIYPVRLSLLVERQR